MAAVAGCFMLTRHAAPDQLRAASLVLCAYGFYGFCAAFSGLVRHSTCLARTHRTCAGGVAWLHISASIPKFRAQAATTVVIS